MDSIILLCSIHTINDHICSCFHLVSEFRELTKSLISKEEMQRVKAVENGKVVGLNQCESYAARVPMQL